MEIGFKWSATRLCSGAPSVCDIYSLNDLDVDVVSKLSKFADDTKLVRGVSSELEAKSLRDDLNKIYQWSVDWQMLFNTEICTVMHMGIDNKEREYLLGGKLLKKSKPPSSKETIFIDSTSSCDSTHVNVNKLLC